MIQTTLSVLHDYESRCSWAISCRGYVDTKTIDHKQVKRFFAAPIQLIFSAQTDNLFGLAVFHPISQRRSNITGNRTHFKDTISNIQLVLSFRGTGVFPGYPSTPPSSVSECTCLR
jgi:hypothetical protein